MKKIYLFIFVLLISLNACNVLNDVDDLSNYSANDVWNNESLSSAYLNNLYAITFGGWPLDGGNGDECTGILGTTYVTPTSSTFKYWPYTKIRAINVLLQNIDQGTLSDKIKNPIKGQALFMRAFLYFNAVKYHGGVPIIKVPQNVTDDLNVKRNSTAECFDFIISDLDEAAKYLPNTYTGSDYGRISKSAVLAFKGRVLLYKASPQFNPNNPYGNQYWSDAYKATKEAYDFLTANGFGLVDNYTDVFETDNHKEAVLPVVYVNPSKTNGRQEDGVRPLSETRNSTGLDMPIWQFVEAFPMKDGKKIGESKKYSYDVQSYWLNRDPRFEQVIVWNGAIYELSGKKGRRQYTAGGIATVEDAGALTLAEASYTRPGVYCRKGIQEELLSSQVELNDVDWLEIRFAEVMFNYAEAANENGYTDIGYQVLKAIRKRAGIEAGNDGMYGLKTGMSRVEMRTALLDEKRIEFCFEGQRFWDLRRHRLLSQLNGMHKYGIWAKLKDGINIIDAKQRAVNYTLMPEEFNYTPTDMWLRDQASEAAMYMPDSYYFFPISLSEIEKNPNLEQNKDWGGTFDPTLH